MGKWIDCRGPVVIGGSSLGALDEQACKEHQCAVINHQILITINQMHSIPTCISHLIPAKFGLFRNSHQFPAFAAAVGHQPTLLHRSGCLRIRLAKARTPRPRAPKEPWAARATMAVADVEDVADVADPSRVVGRSLGKRRDLKGRIVLGFLGGLRVIRDSME